MTGNMNINLGVGPLKKRLPCQAGLTEGKKIKGNIGQIKIVEDKTKSMPEVTTRSSNA
jgi:hypothetical protein